MPSRSLGSALLGVALLSAGPLPFLGTAHADTCASWTDPKGDGTTNQSGQALLADSNLDIVAVALQTVGSNVVARIKVDNLLEGGYSDYGDQHYAQLKVAGTVVRFVAERSELAEKAYLADSAGTTKGAATVVYDHNDSTIAITATQAELDKAAGKGSAGIDATELTAASFNQISSKQVVQYDSSAAPTGMTYTVGAQCAPVVAPLNLQFPTGTCSDIGDGPNDGTPTAIGPAAAPNEPVLDITSVALNATPDTFAAYLKVAKLDPKPANFAGDEFAISFKAGTKTYFFATGRMNGAGHSVTGYPTYAMVNDKENANLKVRGVFDTARNTVVILVERASLDTVNGEPITDGTQVTEVVATTSGIQPLLVFPADTAQATAATDRVFTFGTGKCFPPPPGVLTNVGRTVAQYTDAAAVATKLTSASGDALAGRTVTFTIGSRSVSARTNPAGVATASLNPGLVAGTYSLVTRFAGDASASAVTASTPFSVTLEATRTTLRVAKHGTKRTVYATVKDDDGRPVAGQVVTWYVNGKKSTTSRTSSAGVATFSTTKPTQTVQPKFGTVAGKYAGSNGPQVHV